jgi:hypothetical protein
VRVMSETALHARVFRRRAGFKIAFESKTGNLAPTPALRSNSRADRTVL